MRGSISTGRLNRTQRVAVLAALAFTLYVLASLISDLLFASGWIAYAPLSGRLNWSEMWPLLARFAIYAVAAALWTIIAVKMLRENTMASPPKDIR